MRGMAIVAVLGSPTIQRSVAPLRRFEWNNEKGRRKHMSKDSTQTIVIVGGGFGGMAAARTLRKAPARIVLIDRSNHHLFQPLLYQVAISVLSPGQIASPIRGLLRRQQNTTVILADVIGIDKDQRRVIAI